MYERIFADAEPLPNIDTEQKGRLHFSEVMVLNMEHHTPIVDCHCHIYPDKVAARAVAGISAFYDLDMREDGTKATLQRESADAGVTHNIIFSVATKPSQVRSINEYIAQEAMNSSGTMTGLGTMHPDSESIEGDFRHLVELGLRGVKLHPDVQGFKIDDYRCLKIYELCEKHRLPLLLHTGDKRYDYSNPNRLRPICEIFTGLTIIAAHLGGWSVWDDAAAQLQGFSNLYFDSSSTLPFMEPEQALRLIRHFGADHVLFGTDYPMWVPEDELKRFNALGLNDEEREQILWKNADALFSLHLS